MQYYLVIKKKRIIHAIGWMNLEKLILMKESGHNSPHVVQFSSVAQSCLTLVTPWTAACQSSLSISNSWSLLRFMSIGSVMPPNYLTLSHPLLLIQCFPTSGSFPMSQFFASRGQSIGASASASVLPMNIQDWFPLGLTSLIFVQPKWLSKVLSNTTVQKHQFLGAQLSLYSYSQICTWLLEKP